MMINDMFRYLCDGAPRMLDVKAVGLVVTSTTQGNQIPTPLPAEPLVGQMVQINELSAAA